MTQQTLIDGVPTDDRSGIDPASVSGNGARYELTVAGRRVEGRLMLVRPNPRGRRSVNVGYVAPVAWSRAHHAAALRVAAHWFRDIGGFGSIRKRHLCHIVARLKEDDELTERQIHAAINAYAASPWQRNRRCWVPIQKFFLGDVMDQWIEEAPEHQRHRDAEKQAWLNAENAAFELRMEAQRARDRANLRRQSARSSGVVAHAQEVAHNVRS